MARDCTDDGESDEEAELRALIEIHAAALSRMMEQLNRAEAAVDRMSAHFAAKNGIT
jgi:hypothetical protein